MTETAVSAMDFIVDRIKDGLQFSCAVVATAASGQPDRFSDQVRRYRTLEKWIFSQGYESHHINRTVVYAKRK